MKKLLKLAAVLMAAALATGCGTAASNAGDTGAGTTVEAVAEHNTAVIVSDAALFRGEVTSVETLDGNLLVRLVSAPGTSSDSTEKALWADEMTRLDFTPAPHDYIEVYYEGDTMISATKLMDAEAVNYNGTLLEIVVNVDGTGRMTMQDMTDEAGTTLFNFDGATQFYLDRDNLAPGDKLNLYTTGVYAMSLPPQGHALEVRPYRIQL